MFPLKMLTEREPDVSGHIRSKRESCSTTAFSVKGQVGILIGSIVDIQNRIPFVTDDTGADVYSREGGFYRCSKQAAEHYVEEYQRTYGLDYNILLYGSLYGPRSDESNGLWRIVKHALDSDKVWYEGSPEAMREYIHVEDAARASVTALGNDFRNQHVILTGQEQMRVYDLLKMLAEILGKPNSVEFVEADYEGHYVRTPYAYQPKLGRKYVSPMHVELGQGLLQLIDEVQKNTKKN